MGKRNSTPMTAERILGYLNAVHAAITHKRVPFRATNFRLSYGISPHVHSSMLANGIIYEDKGEDGTMFWRWLADDPSLTLAGQVLIGYKERIKRYGQNAAVTRAEEEARRKAMERLLLVKKGQDNKARLADILGQAKANTTSTIIDMEDSKRGSRMPDDMDAEKTPMTNMDMTGAVDDMLEDVTQQIEERDALEDSGVGDSHEEIPGVEHEVVYIPMTEKQWAFVLKLDAKINRLLRLHGADNVPEDHDAMFRE